MLCTHVVWIGQGKAHSVFSTPGPNRLCSVLPSVIPRTYPLPGMSYGAVVSTLVSGMFGISYYLWSYSDTTKYHKYQMRGAWERRKHKWCSFDKNKYPYSFTERKIFFAEIIREIVFFLLSIFSFNNESQRRQPYRERLLEGFIVIDPVTQSAIGGTSVRQWAMSAYYWC